MDLIIGKPENFGAAPYYAFVRGGLCHSLAAGYSPSEKFFESVLWAAKEIPKKHSLRVIEIGEIP